MRRLLVCLVISFYALSNWAQSSADMQWWRETRFGMIIHWGLYSATEGIWNGKEVPGLCGWIQNFAQIPNSEYNSLVSRLTMENYNPDMWIKMAKDAGVGYIVFTTKHHEGFSMYHSEVSNFNTKLTPYKKDPLKELVAACHKYGVRVGLYYSHRQDWHEEDATVLKKDFDGHFGKPLAEVKPNLDKYIDEKAIPQMKELLTNYGKIDVLWYDTPFDLTKEQSQKFVNVARELQPQCIVNGRVGYGLGDFGALGDNEMPVTRAHKDLEMVATMNGTWGYKRNDNKWKPAKDILCSLIECASRGVNYMINIGPKPDGSIPQPSIDIMNFIGEWMDKKAESIKGTTSNPFNDNFPWGFVTCKNNNLYLHLTREPLDRTIALKGLLSTVKKVTLLDNAQDLSFLNGEDFTLSVPANLDYEKVPVIKITCTSPARYNDICLMNENVISVPVATGKIIPGPKGCLRIGEGGITENFNQHTGKIRMNFVAEQPGTYSIYVYTSRHWTQSFAEGININLAIKNNKEFINFDLKKGEDLNNLRLHSYPETRSKIGTIKIKRSGLQTIELSVNKTGTYVRHDHVGEDIHGLSDNNVRFMRLEFVKE